MFDPFDHIDMRTTLLSLERSGHLIPVGNRSLVDKELRSLERLKKKRPAFLVRFDMLFRYVSLWLISNGYQLSNHQPHRALKELLYQKWKKRSIDQLFKARHRMKYDRVKPGRENTELLDLILSRFEKQTVA